MDAPPRAQPYSAGERVPPGVRRLHLNEFRLEHAPEVLSALAAGVSAGPDGIAARLLTDYQVGPDPTLMKALAAYVGLGGPDSEKSLLLAPGSDEILRAVIDTCG